MHPEVHLETLPAVSQVIKAKKLIPDIVPWVIFMICVAEQPPVPRGWSAARGRYLTNGAFADTYWAASALLCVIVLGNCFHR